MKKRIFMICTVRIADSADVEFQKNYVKQLRDAGYCVHWPPENTNQNDFRGGGLFICRANFRAIFRAREIHVIFNPLSFGTHFDLGMVFAILELIRCSSFLRWLIPPKKIILANPQVVEEQIIKEKASGIKKSFAMVLANLAEK